MKNTHRTCLLFAILIALVSNPIWAKERVITKKQVQKTDSMVLTVKKNSLLRINFDKRDLSKLKLKSGAKSVSLKEFVKGQNITESTQLFIAKRADQMPISQEDAIRLDSLKAGESITVQSGNGDTGDLECWCKASGYGCRVIGF